MDYRTKRIISISLFAVMSLVVAYMAYSLIMYGSPLDKTLKQNVKEGNELYADSLFSQALKPYSKAVAMEEGNLTACYNSATNIISNNLTLKKDDRDVERVVTDYLYAKELLDRVIGNDTVKSNIADCWHNMGMIYHTVARDDSLNIAMNRQLMDKKDSMNYGNNERNLVLARDAYRNALRIDPENDETRYNLAIVQKLLEKNSQNSGGGGGSGQDSDNNDNNDENNDNNDNNENNDGNDKKENEDKQDKKQQNRQQRILNAIMDKEKETREDMNRYNGSGQRRNLEKNW